MAQRSCWLQVKGSSESRIKTQSTLTFFNVPTVFKTFACFSAAPGYEGMFALLDFLHIELTAVSVHTYYDAFLLASYYCQIFRHFSSRLYRQQLSHRVASYAGRLCVPFLPLSLSYVNQVVFTLISIFEQKRKQVSQRLIHSWRTGY